MAKTLRVEGRARRQFVADVLTAAAAMLTSPLLSAQVRPAGVSRPFRIDTHHHFFPPQLDAFYRVRPAENPTVAERIERLDQHGIATAILSIAGAGIPVATGKRASAVARQVNEAAATMAHDRPGRLGFFAALPFFDVDASLAEIAYAFDVLKADGVSLVTSYEGRWPGDPSFAPIWAELNRRRAVVYFHPTDPTCCRDLAAAIGVTSPALEYPFDTTRAIVNLITSGTILRYPNVRLLFSHGGGVAPMLQNRVEWYIRNGQKQATIPNGVNGELRKLYFDTVFVTTRANFAMLTQVLPIDHLLFGTDFPYYELSGLIGELTTLGLSPDSLRAIERDNALALFPQFGSS